MLGLRAGESLLVLLLAERSAASAELLTGLAEVALPLLRPIAQSTAAELSDAKHWHIPGYRCALALSDTLQHGRQMPDSGNTCGLTMALTLSDLVTTCQGGSLHVGALCFSPASGPGSFQVVAHFSLVQPCDHV